MKRITKAELLKKFGEDSSCFVTYKNGNKVHYESMKHINWKNVHKITVEFKEPRWYNVNGESNKRPGAAYLLIQN